MLLRSFEQWWVKGRPEAEALLLELPGMLARAKASGKTVHVGLAELSSSTVDQVIEVLARAEWPQGIPRRPVPVFKYAPV